MSGSRARARVRPFSGDSPGRRHPMNGAGYAGPSVRGVVIPLLLVSVFSLSAASGSAQEPASDRVRVRLEPAVVGVGEVARLAVTVDTTGLSPTELRRPRFELENLEIVRGPARRENFSVVNGRASRTLTLIWFLRAEKPGTARVHGLSVGIGDREISPADQTLQVTEEPQDPPSRERSRRPGGVEDLLRRFFGPDPRRPRRTPEEPPEIRLEARVRPERPYQGQQITYHLDLLVERRRPGQGRIRVESIFPRKIPDFHGFWSEEIPLPDQVRPEVAQIDGRLFWRRPVLRRALYPLRAGELEIEPAELELRALYYRPTAFGEEPAPTEEIGVRAGSVTVHALARPPPPPDFSGPVGRFRLESDLRPGEVDAGDAVTLVLRIEGTGHLGGMEDPELPELPGVEVYPPADETSKEVRGDRMHESRTWTWTLVPSRWGRWTLPPLAWTYFDPEEEAYRTLSSDPHPLAAIGPPSTARHERPETTAPSGTKPSSSPETQGSSKATTPGASLFDPVLRDRLLFGVAAALVALGLGALALLGYRLLPRGGSSGRRLLARLRSLPKEPPRQAATAAEEAWRDFLRERWDLPPGTPVRSWEGSLREEGLDPELTRELVDLMDDLHYLRYAPQLATSDALRENLVSRSRKILRRLR